MRSCRLLSSVLLICSVSLAACQKPDTYRYQSFAFGTLIEIKIRSDDKPLANRVAASLFDDFDRMHSEWHAWQPSPLTQTSAMLTTGKWFPADNAVLPLIKLSKQYSLLSNGLFNPAIGRLIQLWGFHKEQSSQVPPDQNEINNYLAKLPSMNEVEIDDGQMRGRNSLLSLDLGAIAKGYAVKEGIKTLRRQGIEHALVNAGGDLCGIGSNAKHPWQIGIRDPSGKGILASLALQEDECVFTSGDYERNFDYAGKRYHHIIDPRNGYPADQVKSLTVLHKNGALADAASTALFIAGPDDWQEVAIKMGVSDVMMVDKQGRIIMTPSMQKRIKFEPGNQQKVIISKPLS